MAIENLHGGFKLLVVIYGFMSILNKIAARLRFLLRDISRDYLFRNMNVEIRELDVGLGPQFHE